MIWCEIVPHSSRRHDPGFIPPPCVVEPPDLLVIRPSAPNGDPPLRTLPISKKAYRKKAKALKRKILKIINTPARHLGIRNIQFIFRKHHDRLFLWVPDRNIPADNNRAERELRPTVIARKVSFGSQSEQGAKTRSVWMTIVPSRRIFGKNPLLPTGYHFIKKELAFNSQLM